MDFSIQKVNQADGTFKYQVIDFESGDRKMFNTWPEVSNYLAEKVSQQEL